jgi:hypothetical protein
MAPLVGRGVLVPVGKGICLSCPTGTKGFSIKKTVVAGALHAP